MLGKANGGWQHSQSVATDGVQPKRVMGIACSLKSGAEVIAAGMMMLAQSMPELRTNCPGTARGEHAAEEEEHHQCHRSLGSSSCSELYEDRILHFTPFACLHHVPLRACSPARSHHSYTRVSIAHGPLPQRRLASSPDCLPVTGIPLEDGNPLLRQLPPQSHHPLARKETSLNTTISTRRPRTTAKHLSQMPAR